MTPQRIPLIQAPTPLHRLDRLSELWGADIWIKRDDLTGFALGGNKGRKLEYLMAAILASGADAVVTYGGAQSNFIRQLGAACAMHGLRCIAVTMHTPYSPECGIPQGPRLLEVGGNIALTLAFGVELDVHPDGTWDELEALAAARAAELRSHGLNVYEIPVGGSSGLGAYGFYQAAQELLAQASDVANVIAASSSGSTQVGLTMGLRASGVRVVGVACDDEPELVFDFIPIADQLADITGLASLRPSDIELRHGWAGEGYGILTEQASEATAMLAKTEGILLDPIYSAKAFAALRDLVASGDLQGKTVFWHTGGIPAWFAQP